MAIVYCTTNLINGKKYIGSTKVSDANYFGSGVYIKKALKKYGKENFVRQVLWEGESKFRWEMENYWLDYFNCANNKMFYNVSEQAGGKADVNLGRKLSKEHKEAISKGVKGRVTSHKTKVLKSKHLVKINGTDWMTTGELAEFVGLPNKMTVTTAIKHRRGDYANSRKLNKNTLVYELLQKGFEYKTLKKK